MKYQISESEYLYCENENYIKYYDKIKNNNYLEIKILKDNKRSVVKLIEIDGVKKILKITREKLLNKYKRILAIPFGSEAMKEFKGCKKVLKCSFNGPKPILVWEKKKGMQIIDSYFLMSYIEGKECELKEMKMLTDELSKIHKKKLYHGDAHKLNFIISEDTKLYIIDTKLPRDYFGLGKIYDFIELEKSTGFKDFYYKKKWYYKIFFELDIFKEKYDYWRKKIRKKILSTK